MFQLNAQLLVSDPHVQNNQQVQHDRCERAHDNCWYGTREHQLLRPFM